MDSNLENVSTEMPFMKRCGGALLSSPSSSSPFTPPSFLGIKPIKQAFCWNCHSNLHTMSVSYFPPPRVLFLSRQLWLECSLNRICAYVEPAWQKKLLLIKHGHSFIFAWDWSRRGSFFYFFLSFDHSISLWQGKSQEGLKINTTFNLLVIWTAVILHHRVAHG